MSNTSNKKKPAVHRVRKANAGIHPAVFIAIPAALILIAGIIAAIFLMKTKKEVPAETETETESEIFTEATELTTELSSDESESSSESGGIHPSQKETAAQPPYVQEAKRLADQMTLEQKTDQLFIIRPETLVNEASDSPVSFVSQVGEKTQSAYASHPVGGLLLTESNIESGQNLQMLASFCNDLQQKLSPSFPLLLCVKEDFAKNLISVSGETETGTESNTEHFTILDTDIRSWNVNVVFSDCNEKEGENSSQLYPSIQIKDTDQKIDVLNASGGFLAKYSSIDSGSGSYGSTAATNMAYRQDSNNKALVVFEKDIYTVSQDPAELSAISHEVRSSIDDETVIISDITSAADRSDALNPAVASLLLGADLLLCEDNYTVARQSILDAVTDGTLSEEELSEHVVRIISMKLKYWDSNFSQSSAQTESSQPITMQTDSAQSDTPLTVTPQADSAQSDAPQTITPQQSQLPGA